MFHETMQGSLECYFFSIILKVKKKNKPKTTNPNKPRLEVIKPLIRISFILRCPRGQFFQIKVWHERKKEKIKKVAINAVCWTGAKNCGRKVGLSTMSNLTWAHGRSREWLWSKTLCMFTMTWSSLWQRGEKSPKQESEHSEKVPRTRHT